MDSVHVGRSERKSCPTWGARTTGPAPRGHILQWEEGLRVLNNLFARVWPGRTSLLVPTGTTYSSGASSNHLLSAPPTLCQFDILYKGIFTQIKSLIDSPSWLDLKNNVAYLHTTSAATVWHSTSIKHLMDVPNVHMTSRAYASSTEPLIDM